MKKILEVEKDILTIEVENPTIWLMNILQTEEGNNETNGN